MRRPRLAALRFLFFLFSLGAAEQVLNVTIIDYAGVARPTLAGRGPGVHRALSQGRERGCLDNADEGVAARRAYQSR
ncbi:MAG: hypothetical protein ACKV22_41750 [Bryobacteraceae bacterium]